MYGFYSRSIGTKMFCTYNNELNIGYKVWNWFNVDKTKTVYIFEGIFDGISSGLTNIIALMGAKLPDERLKELKDPVFCLDNDGVQSVTDNAIHKAAQRLAGYGKEVFIAIPDQIKGINGAKTDFNDIARKEGINVVRKYINNSISYEQFNKNLNLEKVKEINNKDDYTASNSNKTRDRNMDISVGVVQEPKQPGSFDINKKISLDLEI
jgi:DNA primase